MKDFWQITSEQTTFNPLIEMLEIVFRVLTNTWQCLSLYLHIYGNSLRRYKYISKPDKLYFKILSKGHNRITFKE